jgi:hypothetical protein
LFLSGFVVCCFYIRPRGAKSIGGLTLAMRLVVHLLSLEMAAQVASRQE